MLYRHERCRHTEKGVDQRPVRRIAGSFISGWTCPRTRSQRRSWPPTATWRRSTRCHQSTTKTVIAKPRFGEKHIQDGRPWRPATNRAVAVCRGDSWPAVSNRGSVRARVGVGRRCGIGPTRQARGLGRVRYPTSRGGPTQRPSTATPAKRSQALVLADVVACAIRRPPSSRARSRIASGPDAGSGSRRTRTRAWDCAGDLRVHAHVVEGSGQDGHCDGARVGAGFRFSAVVVPLAGGHSTDDEPDDQYHGQDQSL